MTTATHARAATAVTIFTAVAWVGMFAGRLAFNWPAVPLLDSLLMCVIAYWLKAVFATKED